MRTQYQKLVPPALAVVGAMLLAAQSVARASPGDSPPKELIDPAPASKFLPPWDEVASLQEASIIRNLLTLPEGSDPDDLNAIRAHMDKQLAALREPTKLRGMLQLARSGLLMMMNDDASALQAAEESIRLLPGYSAPLISAAGTYAYANQYGKAADYLLRAIRLDPASVRHLDDYEINNIMRGLYNAHDRRRAELLSERLLEIGWAGQSLTSQSSLVLSSIERRVAEGDIPGARRLVPKLLAPSHSWKLLTNNQYREIWPDIEAWAGRRLEKQWQIYMREARERWAASKSNDTVQDYAAALRAAGHDHSMIGDVLPVFAKTLHKTDDAVLVFVVSGVATSLASLGRWAEVERLFSRASDTWPLGSDANALNVSANRARFLLSAGRPAEALKQMDAAIADAEKWEVNPDALANMHFYRACTLEQLGRGKEASGSIAMTMANGDPTGAASLHLCMGDRKAAKQALLLGLKNQRTRDQVIVYMQDIEDQPFDSEYSRRLAAAARELKADPQLRAETAKYGRIMSFPMTDGAPYDVSAPVPSSK